MIMRLRRKNTNSSPGSMAVTIVMILQTMHTGKICALQNQILLNPRNTIVLMA
jgi:hypothetical protein